MGETRASILIAQGDSEQALSLHLMREGYQVEQTQDARLFLTEYNRTKPDLVVLDSALLGGDAFTLCGRLREQDSVPILMLVPNDDERISRAYRMGASDVLPKPINVTIFCHRVSALVETLEQRAEVRSYERRWQQTFERNRAIQLIVNPQNGQIVDANPAACAFYGYSREEFRQKLIIDLDVPTGTDVIETTLFNFRHRTASGRIRDVKIFSSPIEHRGKTLLYLLVCDISKPAPAQPANGVLAEALRNTASALSGSLDQGEVLDRILEQVSLVVSGESANIMLIEAGVARVARSRGYQSRGKQSVIDHIRLNVQETPALSWMVSNNKALAIANTAEYEGWTKFDESDSWLKSYVAAPIRIGNYVIGFLNIDSSKPHQFTPADAEQLQIFADQAAIAIRNARLFDRVRQQATEMERRVVERTAELEYERSQMRAIIDAMTEGVAYTEYSDGIYHTLYVNQALERITGYSLEDWHTYSLHLFRPKGLEDGAFDQLLKNAAAELRTKGSWHEEARLLRKDGSEFDAVIITTRVYGKDQNVTGLVTVIRDVSQEKALQQQKERFVAYASHELRTPITNLKTRLYLMQRQPERMAEHMRVLEHVTDRMKRLVEDLLDISRFERGTMNLKFERIQLQEIMRKLVDVQCPEAERKQLQLLCELPSEPVHVNADVERLAQVITNLITNAINYTPSGGKITVRLSHVSDVTDDLALVEVEDSGIGIAPEHLPFIFLPFYRVVSNVDGSGLGLSISKEIIELHGGEIDVASEVGTGSTFCFWMPAVNSPRA